MTTMQALLLPVGDDLYALPMDWVREVVAAPTVTRLVTAPSVVLGLFNLRGQIVALLDTAALLGNGHDRCDRLCRRGGRSAGSCRARDHGLSAARRA